MADKQALNATFFAFRKREPGGVLLKATIAYAVIALVLAAAFTALNWQGFIDYMNWAVTLSERVESADPNNPLVAMMPPASVMAIYPMYFLFLVLFYILFAAYEAACLRWMIHGETSGFFGLSLGADTWRVYFTYWLWFFLLIAVYIVCAIIGFSVIAAVAVGAQGGGEPGAAMAIVPTVLIFALLIGIAVLAVRFAPAAATSVARRRFAFFDAWKVTKGRFWALLGAFVLLFLMFIVGAIVISTAASAFMVGGMMGAMQGQPEPQTPQEAFAMFASPGVWIPLALMYALLIVGSFVFYLAMFGVNARAARAALEEGKITPAS